jgi:cytochrome c553
MLLNGEELLKIIQLVCVFYFLLVSNAFSSDIDAGNERYHKNCHNCHGPAGMGVASYPKVAGLESNYIIDRLNRYRSGEKIGSNSGLMISMARKLSDREIEILAAYLSSIN